MADAKGRKGLEDRDYAPFAYLKAAGTAAMNVDIQEILQGGLQGADIGAALAQRRIDALETFKRNYLH
jgi:tRNA nucleotidyltransferase (CCA-adding enzyme)